MKQGDKFPVSLSGHVVAHAVVKYVNEGTAELHIPATKVVMGVRSELTDLPNTGTKETETLVEGVDRQSAVQPEASQNQPSEPVANDLAPNPVQPITDGSQANSEAPEPTGDAVQTPSTESNTENQTPTE